MAAITCGAVSGAMLPGRGCEASGRFSTGSTVANTACASAGATGYQMIPELALEAAHLAGIMAAELRLPIEHAKRCALLHDVGKALTHEVQGSHALIGGMVGAFGGMAMAKYAGWVLDQIGTYTPIFIVAASAYLIALTVVHLLTPRMEPVKL